MSEQEIVEALNRLLELKEGGTKSKLLFEYLRKHIDDSVILTPALLAAIGVGTVENVLAIQELLNDHPGQLSEKAMDDLRQGIAKDFPLSRFYTNE